MIYKNIWKHFNLVCHHKWEVFKLCCRAGIPLQGLMHDLSKFGPAEFIESVRYYDGHRSPLAVSREINGYSKAWLHHQGRNKHHWEYWIDNLGTYENKPCRIPKEYIIEMVCDWWAFSWAKGNLEEIFKWYDEHKEYMKLSHNTRKLVENILMQIKIKLTTV